MSSTSQPSRKLEPDHRIHQQSRTDRKISTPTKVQKALGQLSIKDSDATSPREQRSGIFSYSPSASASATTATGLVKTKAPPTTDQRPTTKQPDAHEIKYTPEAAFAAGNQVLKLIEATILRLEIENTMRSEVWKRELAELSSQNTPRTFIALCGATGSGKSSVVNAILDDTILPTSGMRACTSVVTEISYHADSSISADIEFLTYEEWHSDIVGCIKDLTDNNGHQKKAADLRDSAVAVAWSKIHAVYPKLSQDQLIKMTPDEVIHSNPVASNALGTTKSINSPNSKVFGKAIAQYIDSTEKKRGQKSSDKRNKAEESAWWPLVRVVKIRCSAKALATGAVLVDLPGTEDSNAARSIISQQYMMRCDNIWVFAPITRAVDDKIARDLLGKGFKTRLLMDGNYNTSSVTFIATKTDDLSCSEIIRALELEDHSELREIQELTKRYNQEGREVQLKQAAANQKVTSLTKKLETVKAEVDDLETYIETLKRGGKLEPRRQTKGRADERTKRAAPTVKDFLVDDDAEDSSHVEFDDCTDSASSSDDASSENGDEEASEWEGYFEGRSIGGLKEKLRSAETRAKEIKAQIVQKKEDALSYGKRLSTLSSKLADAQRRKNGVCSKARNEYSREALKEDWRSGIKDMDEEAAMERDPSNFNPGVELRAYGDIHLPTFTVSARDYTRITKQTTGDGGPTCVSDIDDTEIPRLQQWCHDLTVASRENAARSFLTQLKVMASSVQSYTSSVTCVSADEGRRLRDRWASQPKLSSSTAHDRRFAETSVNRGAPGSNYHPRSSTQHAITPAARHKHHASAPVRQTRPNPNGIASILESQFNQLVQRTIEALRSVFRDGLQDKLRDGAKEAEKAAVKTSQAFARSMHWQTFRAHLRRDGVWRRDFNQELCHPMASKIATSWAEVFEQNLFADFESDVKSAVDSLIDSIYDDVDPALQYRCNVQGNLALEDTKSTTARMIGIVRDTLTIKQRDMSRTFSPRVQAQMIPGYDESISITGTGSVAIQQNMLHDYVDNMRSVMFRTASKGVMSSLDRAAQDVGDALEQPLRELARKVEVDMSVLWETPAATSRKTTAFQNAVAMMGQVVERITVWMEAERLQRTHQLLAIKYVS